MKISREDVLRVAELAHLELTGAEVDTYQAQLDQILSYIDKLKELDVANVQPMSQVLFVVPANLAPAMGILSSAMTFCGLAIQPRRFLLARLMLQSRFSGCLG